MFQVSIADIALHNCLELMSWLESILKPDLKTLVVVPEDIKNQIIFFTELPKIKEWIAKRPKTDY